MNKFVVMAILIFVYFPFNISEAATWESATIRENGDTSFVDSSSIVEDKIFIRFWMKSENEEPFKHDGIKTFFALVNIDTENFTSASGKTTAYYETGRTSTVDSLKVRIFNHKSVIAACLGKAEYIQMKKKNWHEVFTDTLNNTAITEYIADPFMFKGYLYFFSKGEMENGDIFYSMYKYEKENNIISQVWGMFLNKNDNTEYIPIIKGTNSTTLKQDSRLQKNVDAAQRLLGKN